MKINNDQITQIENVFKRAEVFISKPTRTSIFDIGFIKIKNKTLLGFHLELYAKYEKNPKQADIQFWIGTVDNLKEETICTFLEDFQFTDSNSLAVNNLKVSELAKLKADLQLMISNNN